MNRVTGKHNICIITSPLVNPIGSAVTILSNFIDIIKVLEHPKLEEIVKNTKNLVEGNFTYGTVVERYRKILEKIKEEKWK